MKKAIFTNKPFYFLLITFIALLLIYNIYMSIKGANIYGLLPIAIETALLIAIITKNRFAKQFVLFWAVILAVADIMSIAGSLFGDLDKAFDNQGLPKLLYNIVSLIVNILIASYAKTIKITMVNEDEDISLT